MRLMYTFVAIGLASGSVGCSDENATTPSGDTVLESVTPRAGASGVDPSSRVTVRFSGPLASGMEQYVDLHRGGVNGAVMPMACAPSADRTTVTCTPAEPLQPGTTYSIHMGAGMMDANGRSVETEEHGIGMGGRPVTDQMMGGGHDGQAAGMMGAGWRHPGDGHWGMIFTFETA